MKYVIVITMVAEKQYKYTVFSNKDIEKYVPAKLINHLNVAQSLIMNGRESDGKDIEKHLVINLNQPYAEPMWEILLAFETLKLELIDSNRAMDEKYNQLLEQHKALQKAYAKLGGKVFSIEGVD